MVIALVWVRSKQSPDLSPFEKAELRLKGRRYVCSVVCNMDQFQKWLGRDYGVLIDFGTGSKGVFEILAMPEDKERAMRRVESLAKEHGLGIMR